MSEDERIGWLDDEELRVFRAFNRCYDAVTARIDEDVESESDLPRTYFEILWRLRREPTGSMRMTRLAEVTHSKASRITHAVGRLEMAGLVRREVAAGDRRGWLAVLTDEGLKRAEEVAPTYANSVRENFLDLLSDPMKRQMIAIGERIVNRIEPR